jgi:hypothetical protein
MPVLKPSAKRFDPRRYNGASLLGLKGIVVKSHGSADQMAFRMHWKRPPRRPAAPAEAIAARMAHAGADPLRLSGDGMIHTRISGTGSYLPGEPVSNAI